MSNYSFFFHWEGWRVQSTLLHLDSNVKQVVIAFTPTKCSWRRKKTTTKNLYLYSLLHTLYTDIYCTYERLRRSKWLIVLEDECSHGLGFFPWLAPDVDSMSADEDRTRIWVFIHCPSHAVFQILLLWCVFNDRHNQSVIISMYIQGTKT